MIKPSLILILMIAVTPGRPSLAQNPPHRTLPSTPMLSAKRQAISPMTRDRWPLIFRQS